MQFFYSKFNLKYRIQHYKEIDLIEFVWYFNALFCQRKYLTFKTMSNYRLLKKKGE